VQKHELGEDDALNGHRGVPPANEKQAILETLVGPRRKHSGPSQVFGKRLSKSTPDLIHGVGDPAIKGQRQCSENQEKDGMVHRLDPWDYSLGFALNHGLRR
jgi:hypothetical protein